MPESFRLATAATLVGALMSGVAVADPEIRWEPYSYETRTGETITGAELGRLSVPERHAAPDEATIELAFVRFRSRAAAPEAPIVWLAGGPSDFGSDDIEGPYLALVREFQEVADVIALDQRGTGLSRPRLDCPENGVALPLDRPYDSALATGEYVRLSRECAAHFAAQGVDLAAYNTVESAHDVDALRRALGVERINLYGASYGTHLALAFLRHHPGAVDRAVLSGVEGPDHTWKLPATIESHFERVFEASRRQEPDRDPDLETMVRTVLARVELAPVTVELPKEDGEPKETITLGASDLRRGLRAFLGSRDNIANLPIFFEDMYAGDFTGVAGYLRRLREVGVGSAMYYCMDCASAATPERRARIAREAMDAIIGDVNAPFPAICEGWPYAPLGEEFRAPVGSDRPVLFLSGTLDGQTPPSNADEVAAGFPRATKVVVEGGSHVHLELEPPVLTKRLAAFFRGEAASDTTFVLPLEFAVPEAARN